jgi:hypothetical protein
MRFHALPCLSPDLLPPAGSHGLVARLRTSARGARATVLAVTLDEHSDDTNHGDEKRTRRFTASVLSPSCST